MSVASVGSIPVMPATPEKLEGPGPDHDGDKDDMGAATAPVQATPPAGLGTLVNKTA